MTFALSSLRASSSSSSTRHADATAELLVVWVVPGKGLEVGQREAEGPLLIPLPVRAIVELLQVPE